jgi:cobalt/nickel transport system permease protein
MALAHLTIAGMVEVVLTAGVVAYLQRANLPVLRINHPGTSDVADRSFPRRLGWRWGAVGLGVAALLTPLGLLARGRPFGEDAPKDLDLAKYHLQAVPNGLAHYAGFWHNAFFDGYGFSHDRHPALGYVVSAFVGIAAIAIVVVASRLLIGVGRRRHSASKASIGSAGA